MKKIYTIIITLLIFSPMQVYAATDYTQEIDSIAQKYNTNIITSGSIEDVFTYITEMIQDNYKKPLKISAKILSVIVLYSLSKALFTDKSGDNIMDAVSVLITFMLLITPLKQIFAYVTDNLFQVKNFMTTFIPVFSGILLGSGEVFTSVIYTGFFLTAMIAVSNMCINVVIPSVRIYISIIISDALSKFINLGSIGEFYLKAVKNIMKISVSAICFIFTLQTTISRGKDTLAVKAGKMLAGSAIPVIGSTLQDAVSGVYAGMESIKGYAGVTGLAVVAMIFLPSVISLAVYWLYINLLYMLGDILDVLPVCRVIKGFVNVIELVLSVIALYVVMFIFSVTIMIAITNGV